MTESNIRKNIQLSNEFDHYVVSHPTASGRIPRGAQVILTSSKDKVLSAANMSIAERSRGGTFVIAHKTDGHWKITGFKK